MTAVTVDDKFLEEMRRKDAELEQFVRIDGDYLMLGDYKVLLATCSTHQGVLNWVWHLSDKTWVTREVLHRFIELACGYSKLEYRV